MNETTDSILDWLSRQPKWLQAAAKHFLEQGKFEDEDISKFADLCLKETKGDDISVQSFMPSNIFSQKINKKIRLNSIGNIEGIGAFAPDKKLDFNCQDLVVVYGRNGSGKSGYIDILKRICGTNYDREQDRKNLKPNIYKPPSEKQEAVVEFQEDDDIKMQSLTWEGKGEISELIDIEIFDTSFGRIFTSEEKEACYEPPQLLFFSELSNFCGKVKEKLGNEKLKYSVSKLTYSAEFEKTGEVEWYLSINAQTKEEEIKKYCSFTDTDEVEKNNLIEQLKEGSFADKSRKLLGQKQNLDSLIKDAEEYKIKLSDDKCLEIVEEKINKRKMEEEVGNIVQKTFSDGYLNGTGKNLWQSMWKASKEYFENEAYREQNLTDMVDGELCVLCQQPLKEEAKKKFEIFKDFMGEKIKEDIESIQLKHKGYFKNLENIPVVEDLERKIKLSGLDEGSKIYSQIMQFFLQLRSRNEELKKELTEVKNIPPLEQEPQWISESMSLSESWEKMIRIYENSEDSFNREVIQNKLNALLAKKWLQGNCQNVKDEVIKMQELNIFDEAIQKTLTTKLSNKKKEFSQELITEPFKRRFNKELQNLGADRLKVKIKYDRTEKTRVLHKLVLYDADTKHGSVNITDILSEGERRIISIAAFLADVTGKNSQNPFLFDDPISSLDDFFEEQAAERLIELSNKRQVIIFTHRLSFLYTIEKLAAQKNKNSNVINIGSNILGIGIPTPMLGGNQKISSALNGLLDERASRVKKHYSNGNDRDGNDALVSMCVDFRILLERCVEENIFCNVVNRFRHDIQTQRLRELKNILSKDYKILDKMMSEYSKYVHSHSRETGYKLPDFDKFIDDIEEFKNWYNDYLGRQPSFVDQS